MPSQSAEATPDAEVVSGDSVTLTSPLPTPTPPLVSLESDPKNPEMGIAKARNVYEDYRPFQLSVHLADWQLSGTRLEHRALQGCRINLYEGPRGAPEGPQEEGNSTLGVGTWEFRHWPSAKFIVYTLQLDGSLILLGVNYTAERDSAAFAECIAAVEQALATLQHQPSNFAPVGGGSPLSTPMTIQPLTPTLNADTPPPWEMMKLTGISFDYSGGSVITSTTAPPDSEYGASVDISSGDSFFQVGTSIGWELIADDAYPYNIPPNEGPWRYYFPTRVAVEGATKAWLFVIGIRHPETEEWEAVEGSRLEPYASLDAVIYNEECDIFISIRTSFDLADTEQVEATSLDQVVAERYPIFDHMVRSVRFPEQCAGD